jgi:hypothetical protein
MFDFIKRLFKKEEKVEVESPVVVHAEVNETIVIKEVALAEVAKVKRTPKPKTPKVVVVAETEIPVIAKGVKEVKPKVPKSKKVKAEPAKIVQLVQPVSKSKGRPKKTPSK